MLRLLRLEPLVWWSSLTLLTLRLAPVVNAMDSDAVDEVAALDQK